MKNVHTVLAGMATLAMALSFGQAAATQYDSDETRELIEAMVAAHGGAERWFAAPSIKFTATMYLASLPLSEERTLINNWRHYHVTIDPDTSEAYIDMGLDQSDEIYAAATRERYWRLPGIQFDVQYQDGPFQLAWYHYGMMALPFLSQQDSAIIERQEDVVLPGVSGGEPLMAFRMRFEPVGRTIGGSITIMVDPDTNLIMAWRNGAWVPDLPGGVLPDELAAPPGGPLRIVDRHQVVDGFVLPLSYRSGPPDGDPAGMHLIHEVSVDQPFDRRKLAPPPGAEIVFERSE